MRPLLKQIKYVMEESLRVLTRDRYVTNFKKSPGNEPWRSKEMY